MNKDKFWYGIQLWKEGKMIILWETSQPPEESKSGDGNLVLETSKGRVKFLKTSVFDNKRKALDKINVWIKKNPEYKDYSVQTH